MHLRKVHSMKEGSDSGDLILHLNYSKKADLVQCCSIKEDSKRGDLEKGDSKKEDLKNFISLFTEGLRKEDLKLAIASYFVDWHSVIGNSIVEDLVRSASFKESIEFNCLVKLTFFAEEESFIDLCFISFDSLESSTNN